MAWFVLMAEEGVECFKDFSFLSEQVAEVGVIIHWHSTVHTHNINDHAIPLFFHFSPPFITVKASSLSPFGLPLHIVLRHVKICSPFNLI